MKKFIYYLIQFTWGFLENIIGFFVFLFFITKPHKIYNNCFETIIGNKYNASFSIGNFIFMSYESTYDLKHERGHCLQNLIFGPLSLFAFKIPSVIHWWYIELITHDWSNYYEFYAEKSANRLGGNI